VIRPPGGNHLLMATPPPRRDRDMLANGSKLLLLGGVLAAIGIILMLLLDGYGNGIGVAFASLACVPTLAGLGLTASALVSRRARAGKPFA
jgi:hypothetical protein